MFVSFEGTMLHCYNDDGMKTDTLDVSANIKSAYMNGNTGLLITEYGTYRIEGENGYGIQLFQV